MFAVTAVNTHNPGSGSMHQCLIIDIFYPILCDYVFKHSGFDLLPVAEPCCPPNSVFSECAPSNPPTCVDPSPVCDRPCTAACVCNDGFVWDNGACIPVEQCGCFDPTTGNYYPVNICLSLLIYFYCCFYF